MATFSDAHCHMVYLTMEDREQVFRRCEATGVGLVMQVARNLEDSYEAIAVAKRFPQAYAGVGVNWQHAASFDQATYEELKRLAREPKVVAICEAGLNLTPPNDATKAAQLQALREQVRLAREVRLPIMVHCGQIFSEHIQILQEERAYEVGGALLHGSLGCTDEQADAVLDMGFHFSFGRVLLRSEGEALVQLIRRLPRDRILIETDSTSLPPQGGAEAIEPAAVVAVAEAMARILGVTTEEIAEITTTNLKRHLRIPSS